MILHFYTTTITLTNYCCLTYDWTLVQKAVNIASKPAVVILPPIEKIGSVQKMVGNVGRIGN